MNWEVIEGRWLQFAGKVKERWGTLNGSNGHIHVGKMDQLVGLIKEHYGLAAAHGDPLAKLYLLAVRK